MRQLLLLLLSSITFLPTSFIFQDKVKLEIIDENKSVKKVEFAWPYPDSVPVGSTKALLNEIDKMLNSNGVDCPPKREKLSDNIWKCGNGKKIRTNDQRLIKLLSKAWQ